MLALGLFAWNPEVGGKRQIAGFTKPIFNPLKDPVKKEV